MSAKRLDLMFLVNGGLEGAAGIRAQSLARRLDGIRVDLAFRKPNKIAAIVEFFVFLVRWRPRVLYVVDCAYSGIVAAAIYKCISECRLIVDTGDAIYELTKLSGSRGLIGVLLTRALEQFSLKISDRVIVRSHPHAELLAAKGIEASVIPDGVDTRQFAPDQHSDLRKQLNLEGATVIGLVGSLIWNQRWQMCYGWDLIRAIGLLRNRPVKGLIIGDGSGLERLRTECKDRKIEDRVIFAGRVPYDALPAWINLMDITISTQTDDTAGRVRTSGKLPLYLACGRFVLASAVGEAVRVLPSDMLIPYKGTRDESYPERLAERIAAIMDSPEALNSPAQIVRIASTHFDYDVLAQRLRESLAPLIPCERWKQEHSVKLAIHAPEAARRTNSE